MFINISQDAGKGLPASIFFVNSLQGNVRDLISADILYKLTY